jgi:hypothetical protein
MEPKITLSQLSHLGIKQDDLDNILNDHEQLVAKHMTNAAKHTCGNVLGVGVTTAPRADGKPGTALLLLVDTLDHAATQRLSGKTASGYPVVLEAVGAISASSVHESGNEVSAERHAHGLEASQGFQAKYRPVTCGVSIAPDTKLYSGTLGCQVKSNGVKYMLSNNHVLADCNTIAPGTWITQPSREDGRAPPADGIGELSHFVPLAAAGGTSPVDAAIAAFFDVQTDPRMERGDSMVEKMTAPIVRPVVDLNVQKSGRTTGVTKGKVAAIGLTIAVNYPSIGLVTIENTFSVKHASGQFSRGGDSGSVITTAPQNNPVGLLFAADSGSKATYANTMHSVLEQLALLTGDPVEIVY